MQDAQGPGCHRTVRGVSLQGLCIPGTASGTDNLSLSGQGPACEHDGHIAGIAHTCRDRIGIQKAWKTGALD